MKTDTNWENWKKKKVKLYFGTSHIMHEKSHGIPYINAKLGKLNFIKKILASERSRWQKEMREKFIEIAIKGAKDPDELKGLYLYSRFLAYLDDAQERGGGK